MKKKKLRNKFENKLDKQLKRYGIEYTYEGASFPYTLTGRYIPDFIVGGIVIEAKGYLRPEHKRKMIAVKRQHPQLDIRFVFYSHREAYIKWADKHGFPWAIGKIPETWLSPPDRLENT